MKTARASLIAASTVFMAASFFGNVNGEEISSTQPETRTLTIEEAKELIQYTKLKKCVDFQTMALELIRRSSSEEELQGKFWEGVRKCETETGYTAKQFDAFQISIAKTYGSNENANRVVQNSTALLDKLWDESELKPAP